MSAVRLARAFTRRDRVIKFAGCYHGHVDALLASAGSGLATLGIPSTPGRPDRRRGGHDRLRVQRRRRRRGRGRALRRGARRDRRRAGRREHGRRPARARLPRGAARALRRLRRAARLRRGDHRLPRRARRRAGALRRHARPDHPRQDRRRRPAARRVRRPRRGDGAARPVGRRLPGGDALREPARDGGGPLRAAPAARPRRLRASSSDGRAARGGRSRRSARVQRVGAMATLFLADGAGAQLRRRASAPTPSATARSSGTCSSAASTSRRRSSSACSSRSPTATRRSTAPSRPLASFFGDLTLWETLAARRGRREPALGRGAAARAERERRPSSRRSPRERFALGVETIYEGYLLHYGRPRLFAPADADAALLLGDYLYAHGLVRIAATGERRRRRRPRRADLALRAAARRRPPTATARRGPRRRALGTGGSPSRGRADARTPTRRSTPARVAATMRAGATSSVRSSAAARRSRARRRAEARKRHSRRCCVVGLVSLASRAGGLPRACRQLAR